MAKKKTENENPLAEETVETEVVEETVTEETHDESQGKAGDETPTVQETTEETLKEETVETEVVEETKPELVAKEQDIPEDVLKTLAIFPEMEFLYVGKGGGIWRNGTPESIRGKAVLYKNPYFKNNKTEK
jgi:hypothetical protein